MSLPEDSWPEWSRHVLAELKRLNNNLAQVENKIDLIKDEQITPLKVEIAMLKIKASIFGLVGGAIPVVLMVLIEILKKP